MADLRNLDVEVDYAKNESRYGPGGGLRLQSTSYLRVGGTRDIYSVSMNFEKGGAHWCEKESGARCHGNGNGKTRTYGKPSVRDKHNPNHWCKHVTAAMAATEMLAEAQEISARTFGADSVRTIKGRAPVLVTVKPSVPAFGRKAAQTAQKSAAKRLAELEAETLKVRAEVAAEEDTEIREVLAALVAQFSPAQVKEALKEVA